MPDPDRPIADIDADDPAWRRPCPKCGAKPDDDCVSVLVDQPIIGVHAERLDSW